MIITDELVQEYLMEIDPELKLNGCRVYDYGTIGDVFHILYNYISKDITILRGHKEVAPSHYEEWLSNK